MNITETKINIGLPTKCRIIHITDTHLAYADERDDERKIRLSQNRNEYSRVRMAKEALEIASNLSKQHNLPIVHTGDLLDFISVPNLEIAKQFMDENDCFFAAGNHEFTHYIFDDPETVENRTQRLPLV